MRILRITFPAILSCAFSMSALPISDSDTTASSSADTAIVIGNSTSSDSLERSTPGETQKTALPSDSCKAHEASASHAVQDNKTRMFRGLSMNDRLAYRDFFIGKNNLLPAGPGLFVATNDFLFVKLSAGTKHAFGLLVDFGYAPYVWNSYRTTETLLDSNKSHIEKQAGLDSAVTYPDYGYRFFIYPWQDEGPSSLNFIQQNRLNFWLDEHEYKTVDPAPVDATVMRGYYNLWINARHMFGINLHYIKAQEIYRQRSSLFTAMPDTDSGYIAYRKEADIKAEHRMTNIGFDMNPSFTVQLNQTLSLYVRTPFEYRRMMVLSSVDRTYYSLDSNIWHSNTDVAYVHHDSLQYFYAVLDTTESDRPKTREENGWWASVRFGLMKRETQPYELNRLWVPLLGQMIDLEAYYSTLYMDQYKVLNHDRGFRQSAGLSFASLQTVRIPRTIFTGVETFFSGSYDDLFGRGYHDAWAMATLIPTLIIRDLVFVSLIEMNGGLYSDGRELGGNYIMYAIPSISVRYAASDWGFSVAVKQIPYKKYFVTAWKSW